MTADPMPHPRTYDDRFFRRQEDGSVRVRMKLTDEEATLIEEAAGTTPVLVWMFQAINSAAAAQVRKDRQLRPIAPPQEQA